MIIQQDRQAQIDAVNDQIRQLIWHAQKQALLTLSRPGIDLTLPQMITLHAIHADQPCRMSDLAEATKQSAGTLTGIVDRLILDGLVARVRDAGDRRVVHVALTPAGKERLDQVDMARHSDMHRILVNFSDHELDSFADLLNRFLGGIHQILQREHRN
jgi:DNA-binding MarR family transcriptional regulator